MPGDSWATRGALLVAALVLAGCTGGSSGAAPTTTRPPATTTTEAPAPTYEPFADVDTYSDGFFIALEGTGIEDRIGEERAYGAGVAMCRELDGGASIEAVISGRGELGLGDGVGSLLAAAATQLCEQHEDAVREWVEENGG